MKPTVTTDSGDCMESAKSPWVELFKDLTEINMFDTPNLPPVRNKEFNDSTHKTFKDDL